MDLRKEVLYYDALVDFPTNGQENKLYLNKADGALYYWDGSAYALAGDGSGGVTDVTADAPLASSGGATPKISLTVPGDASKFLDGTGNFSVPASGSSSGRFGIADSTGAYTYYTTLQAAITAASAGQTVEMFTDYTEAGAVTITLKDGVNINGNGHTYTLTSSTTDSCLSDNGVAVTSSILNLNLVRTGANVGSTTSTACLLVTGASKIKCDGSKFTGTNSTNAKCGLIIDNSNAFVSNAHCVSDRYSAIIVTAGTLVNSSVENVANNPAAYIVGMQNTGGIIENCTVKYTGGSQGIVNAGTAINCSCYATSGTAFYNSGKALNCAGYNTGGVGFQAHVNTISENCSGYSSAGFGIQVNGGAAGKLINCSGYSTSNFGISSYNGLLYNCVGYSTANYGISHTNGGDGLCQALNCTAISDAAPAYYVGVQNPLMTMSNCSLICRWNNTSGHALSIGVNIQHNLIGNTYQVTNASANAIYSSVATNQKYADSKYIGSTTPINANITQAIVNTEDNQGNILI